MHNHLAYLIHLPSLFLSQWGTRQLICFDLINFNKWPIYSLSSNLVEFPSLGSLCQWVTTGHNGRSYHLSLSLSLSLSVFSGSVVCVPGLVLHSAVILACVVGIPPLCITPSNTSDISWFSRSLSRIFFPDRSRVLWSFMDFMSFINGFMHRFLWACMQVFIRETSVRRLKF